MAATGVATAAGTAVLVYLVLSGRLCGDAGADGGDDRLISAAVAEAAAARRRRKEEARARKEQRRKRRWPERAPAGWGEAAAVAARTVRFTWGETLGKWPLGELAFGIKYYMRQQVLITASPLSIAAAEDLFLLLCSCARFFLSRTPLVLLFFFFFVRVYFGSTSKSSGLLRRDFSSVKPACRFSFCVVIRTPKYASFP